MKLVIDYSEIDGGVFLNTIRKLENNFCIRTYITTNIYSKLKDLVSISDKLDNKCITLINESLVKDFSLILDFKQGIHLATLSNYNTISVTFLLNDEVDIIADLPSLNRSNVMALGTTHNERFRLRLRL